MVLVRGPQAFGGTETMLKPSRIPAEYVSRKASDEYVAVPGDGYPMPRAFHGA